MPATRTATHVLAAPSDCRFANPAMACGCRSRVVPCPPHPFLLSGRGCVSACAVLLSIIRGRAGQWCHCDSIHRGAHCDARPRCRAPRSTCQPARWPGLDPRGPARRVCTLPSISTCFFSSFSTFVTCSHLHLHPLLTTYHPPLTGTILWTLVQVWAVLLGLRLLPAHARGPDATSHDDLQ